MRVRTLLLACTILATLPLPAFAQSQPPADDKTDVVIVTAQKRAQDIQDVPVAVTALGGEALQDQHVTSVLDMNALAPSLQVKTDDNAANPKIFIRGIGLNDFNPTTASAVAIYSDGVYIGSPLAQMGAFFDLDRVEVLRGPQGTLYGRNTTGGAINLISKKPSRTPEGQASIEVGDYDSVTVDAGFGGPVTDDLAYRVAGTYMTNSGYTLNRLTGDRGNDTNRGSLRATFDWTPSENFDALIQFRYGHSAGGSIWAYNRSLFPATAAATGPDGFCAPGFYTSGQCTDIAGYANTSNNLYQGDYHLEGKDKVETYGASATLTWDLGGMSLVSVSGYDHADRDDIEDTDAGPNDVITARYRAKQWAGSEELRLQSNGKNTFDWVVGVYIAREELDTKSYYDVLRIFNANDPATEAPLGIGVYGWPFTQDTNSYAVFGQVDYHINDRLTATVGLRYSADEKKFQYDSVYSSNVGDPTFNILPTFNDSKTFDSVSGKLGLEYEVSDDVNVYASYNRGYKSGGFFGGQTTDPTSLKPYNDEFVDAYEVGLKSRLLGDTLTANLAAFFYDYQDLQVYTLVVDPNTNLTTQNFTNASNAEVKGFEAELAYSPIDGLDLSLGASFLDAEYKDFQSAGADYSGNRLPNAPETSLNGSARYEWDLFGGKANAQANVTYRSKVFYDTRNVERLSDGDRTFVDLRLGWKPAQGGVELGVFGRNVFGETNIGDIIPIEGLGFDLFAMGPRQTAGLYARMNY